MAASVDIWQEIRKEADVTAHDEPILASFLFNTILNHETLENAMSYHLANKLQNSNLQPTSLMELFIMIYNEDPRVGDSLRSDIAAVKERDPACPGYSVPLLYFKGFQALQSYRMAHWLWTQGRKPLALALQARISEVFGVDIHPAAVIGNGILFDHATGLVIGETAVVGNNVSVLHGVTLGGTGKDCGDRHPKIGDGVLIGAGSELLGNIKIGEGCKIGAGSVVLDDLPAHCTAVGVPARVVGHPTTDQPALDMDHKIIVEEGQCPKGQDCPRTM